MRKPYRTILLKHHTATTNEVPLLHDANMVFHKMALRDDVTVYLYDIRSLCRRDCLVQYDGSAEPLIFLPDVPDWHREGIPYVVNEVLGVGA